MNAVVTIAIDKTTGQTKVAQLLTTASGALGRMSGRDQVSPDEPTMFNRYVLTGTVPEIPVVVYIGYDASIGVDILATIQALPAVLIRQREYGATLTIAEIERRLVQWAREDGHTHVWKLSAGDNTNGLILNKFSPL